MIVALLAGLAGSLNYYKVPPVMPILMGTFHINRTFAGFLMSIFSVAGLTLSIPSGMLLEKLRGRTAGAIAICFILAGSVVGALSSHFSTMLAGRFLEGVGLSLISVVAPMVITFRFEPKKLPTAISIYSTSYPIAATIALIFAPLLASRFGWQSAWWCGSIYALITLFLYLAFIKPLTAQQKTAFEERKTERGPFTRKAFLDIDAILMGIMFCSYGTQFNGFLTWTPTFLYNTRGISLAHSSLLLITLPAMGIISAIFTGWLSGKVLHRRLMCAIIMMVFSALLPWVTILKTEYILIYMAFIGFIGAMVPTFIYTFVADLTRQSNSGNTPQALVNMGQYTGMLIGPSLFALFVDMSGNWTISYWLLFPMGLVGATATLILRARLHRKIRAGILPASTR